MTLKKKNLRRGPRPRKTLTLKNTQKEQKFEKPKEASAPVSTTAPGDAYERKKSKYSSLSPAQCE